MTSNAASTPPAGARSDAPDAAVPTQTAPADAADSADSASGTPTTPTAGAGDVRAGRDLAVVPDPGPDPAGLHGRALEARALLIPERAEIPAPRSPQGVTVPAAFGKGPHQPSAEIIKATDELVADLATLREKPDEPAHRALVRIGELTAAGIPEEGWSRAEELDPEVIGEASAVAGELHATASALLERLDAEKLAASAVVVDGMATSLQVMRIVADLEVFARGRL